MVKIYKILILAYFITTARIAFSQTLLAYHEPQITLSVNANPDRQPTASSWSSSSAFTHNSYKITQETKKISASLVQKEAVLLLHLTAESNQVYVQASDGIGHQVMSAEYLDMDKGFYEIPVLPGAPRAQLYFVSVVINHKIYSFQIAPTP